MIIAASWVVPVSGPPIRSGAVRLRDGLIVEIGPRAHFAELNSSDDESAGTANSDAATKAVVELGDAILTPGLVNPHTHLELTCYEGRIAAKSFWSWLTELVKLRRAPGAAAAEEACIAEAAWRSLRAGVTCVGDISRRNVSWRMLKRIPIRKVCFVELLTLADDPPRTPEELIAELDSMEPDGLLTPGITPHAPYSVPLAHLTDLAILAVRRSLPFTTHWAETVEEVAFLRGDGNLLPPLLREVMESAGVTSPELSPVEYLLSSLSKRAVTVAGKSAEEMRSGADVGMAGWSIAHANYVTQDEFELLRRSGLAVIYCPRAHAFFGHRPHPIAAMRSRGIRVVLGTDSAASNIGSAWRRASDPDTGITARMKSRQTGDIADRAEPEGCERLSVLEEARFAAEVYRVIAPEEFLRMITIDAAAALGLADQIGTLEPGKAADLTAWSVGDAIGGDPLRALLGASARATGVWVAGRRVV